MFKIIEEKFLKMKFKVIKQLDLIRELYESPLNPDRFKKYLFLLQGNNKEDILLPIAGFNPMAKEHATQKLMELIELKAEEIAQEELKKINKQIKIKEAKTIKLGINLVDDLAGAWSERCTTDYKSKFEFQSMLKRNFCTPLFFTSESYTIDLIRKRIQEYCHRIIYWLTEKEPQTLGEFLEQEIYVQRKSLNTDTSQTSEDFETLRLILEDHHSTKDFQVKFNFFYGDEASDALSQAKFGVSELTGFDYAKIL